MILNSAMKSGRCVGSSLARAARRPWVSSARIISRMGTMRPLLEEHMLGAAEPDAVGAEGERLAGVGRRVGVGAHFQSAEPSAHPIRRSKSAESIRLAHGTRPLMICPVEPSMVTTSPFSEVSPRLQRLGA